MERPRPKIKKVFDKDESKDGASKGDDKAIEFTKEAQLNAALIDSDEVVVNIEDDRLSNPGSMSTPDIEEFEDKSYKDRLKEALDEIELAKNELLVAGEGGRLNEHSPKFEKMLKNINNQVVNTDSTTSDGTHLVYSFFNNVEGLNIFRMVLEANGYARFKIGLDNGIWKIDMNKEDLQKLVIYCILVMKKQKKKNF